MRIRSVKSFAFVWIVAYALLGASVSVAESSQTSSVVNFEVLSVDGNRVVIRDQNGTREITVPDNFKFTVDGKSMSVNELTAGMKGSATVTTTTTVRPVYVTEIRKGTVLRQSAQTIIVRGQDGTRRFTQDEADANGMEIFMDGKPVKVWQLRAGDEFTALIVSAAAPEILTEKEVAATLAAPEPEPVAAAPEEQPAPVAAPAPEPTPAPAPMEEAPAPAAMPAAVAPAPVPAPKEDSGWLMWLLIVIVVGVVAFVLMRRRTDKT